MRDYPNIGTIHSDVRPGLRALQTGDNERRVVRIICVSDAGQDWQRIAKSRE